MTTDNVITLSLTAVVLALVLAAVMTSPMKLRPMPTEAEMIMMERIAKVAAMAQGECK